MSTRGDVTILQTKPATTVHCVHIHTGLEIDLIDDENLTWSRDRLKNWRLFERHRVSRRRNHPWWRWYVSWYKLLHLKTENPKTKLGCRFQKNPREGGNKGLRKKRIIDTRTLRYTNLKLEKRYDTYGKGEIYNRNWNYPSWHEEGWNWRGSGGAYGESWSISVDLE